MYNSVMMNLITPDKASARKGNRMTDKNLELLTELPVFPTPDSISWSGLRVDGLVKMPATFTLKDFEFLPLVEVVEDFQCEEGWVAANQRWEGVSVANFFEVSGMSLGTRYIGFSAGDFTVTLPVEEAMATNVIIALRHQGQLLTAEHGGPCRLVVPGKECFYSVKWVDRMTALAKRPEETGKSVALQRIAGKSVSGGSDAGR